MYSILKPLVMIAQVLVLPHLHLLLPHPKTLFPTSAGSSIGGSEKGIGMMNLFHVVQVFQVIGNIPSRELNISHLGKRWKRKIIDSKVTFNGIWDTLVPRRAFFASRCEINC